MREIKVLYSLKHRTIETSKFEISISIKLLRLQLIRL
ncbi:MAG: hypothetical protein K0S31_3521 [Sphingobacterium multivorum]|jgi:hypothetical protein|nr:hypothetical protein [Sphingobacterium multivorum]